MERPKCNLCGDRIKEDSWYEEDVKPLGKVNSTDNAVIKTKAYHMKCCEGIRFTRIIHTFPQQKPLTKVYPESNLSMEHIRIVKAIVKWEIKGQPQEGEHLIDHLPFTNEEYNVLKEKYRDIVKKEMEKYPGPEPIIRFSLG